jgi:putative spermidine/putrescine transport system ATP-binding protein
MALADLVVLMNGGKIEQAGSPAEVFNAPRTAFVAQFMGGHNVIVTPAGKIAVRADKLRLRPEGRGPGRLSATVRAIEYQGTHHQVTLAAPVDGDLTAILSEDEFDAIAPRPGDGMLLDWNDRDVHPLAA